MDFQLPQQRQMSSKQPSNPQFKLNKWAVAALLASLSFADGVNAAGLGKLKVLSRLGQPFAAEIELINVTKNDLGTLNVIPASRVAYQAANLRFDPALFTMRLSLERHENGTPYIRATTSARIAEPYLDLLVEITSQDGMLQRSYSALLDLPDVVKSTQSVTAPVTAAAAPTPKTEVMPPRAAIAPPARKPVAAAVQPPVVTAPVPSIAAVRAPAVPAPAASAAVANNVVSRIKPKNVEPAKPEPPKLAAATVEPAATEAPKAEPPKLEPKETASAPVPQAQVAVPKKVNVPPQQAPQQSVFDTMKNHLALIGGILLALLAGIVGLWMLRRRNQDADEALVPITPRIDTATLRHEVTADAATAAGMAPYRVPAVQAAADERRPDTTVASVTESVDPIDEAKVYLEHGQDEPAEKILREALSKQPGRVDIHMLMLEILAQRGDKDGFNQLAGRLHKQTGGLGEHWKRTMAMGYAIDPSYPLYSPPEAVANRAEHPLASDSLDIDLGSPASVTDAPAPMLDISFELPQSSTPPLDVVLEPTTTLPADEGNMIDFKIDFSGIQPKQEAAPAAPAALPMATATDATGAQREEIQQKIDLARAYIEMGDKEGALEQLSEVEHEGDAGQQAEARALRQSLE